MTKRTQNESITTTHNIAILQAGDTLLLRGKGGRRGDTVLAWSVKDHGEVADRVVGWLRILRVMKAMERIVDSFNGKVYLTRRAKVSCAQGTGWVYLTETLVG